VGCCCECLTYSHLHNLKKTKHVPCLCNRSFNLALVNTEFWIQVFECFLVCLAIISTISSSKPNTKLTVNNSRTPMHTSERKLCGWVSALNRLLQTTCVGYARHLQYHSHHCHYDLHPVMVTLYIIHTTNK
jgi:hypothetical protein